MKIGTWILSLMSPLISKILALLGFSVVTIVGFDVAVGKARAALISSVGGLPVDMLNVVLLAGFGKAISMIVAAIMLRLMLWKIQSATKILGVNPG